jgi:hypothetical protein
MPENLEASRTAADLCRRAVNLYSLTPPPIDSGHGRAAKGGEYSGHRIVNINIVDINKERNNGNGVMAVASVPGLQGSNLRIRQTDSFRSVGRG